MSCDGNWYHLEGPEKKLLDWLSTSMWMTKQHDGPFGRAA